jgi:hypothetical protein
MDSGEAGCRGTKLLGLECPVHQMHQSLLYTSIPRWAFFLVTNHDISGQQGGAGPDYANHLDYADTLE